MKTTFLFLCLSLFLLTACQPGDPDVLSAADKSRFGGNRNPRNKNDSQTADVRIPRRVELPMGLLVEARVDQGLQILGKAMELVKADAENLLEGCLLFERSEKSPVVLKYKVQFQDCKMTSAEKTFVYSGNAQMDISLTEAGGIQKLAYFNTFSTGSSMVYLLESDVSLSVVDQMDLELEAAGAGTFALTKLLTETTMVLDKDKDSETTYLVSSQFSQGRMVIEGEGAGSLQYAAFMKGQARNKAGKQIDFTFEGEKKMDSNKMDFKKTFGNNPNKNTGSLILEEESVTLVPFKGKNFVQSREKIGSKFNGALPLGLWLAQP